MIAYMVNLKLHVNKAFKEKVEKFMNDTFGTITKTFIKNNMKIRIPVFYHY